MPISADTKCYGDIVLRKECCVIESRQCRGRSSSALMYSEGVQASEFAYIVSCARDLAKDIEVFSRETNG
jgi:hypothetical protein